MDCLPQFLAVRAFIILGAHASWAAVLGQLCSCHAPASAVLPGRAPPHPTHPLPNPSPPFPTRPAQQVSEAPTGLKPPARRRGAAGAAGPLRDVTVAVAAGAVAVVGAALATGVYYARQRRGPRRPIPSFRS